MGALIQVSNESKEILPKYVIKSSRIMQGIGTSLFLQRPLKSKFSVLTSSQTNIRELHQDSLSRGHRSLTRDPCLSQAWDSCFNPSVSHQLYHVILTLSICHGAILSKLTQALSRIPEVFYCRCLNLELSSIIQLFGQPIGMLLPIELFFKLSIPCL